MIWLLAAQERAHCRGKEGKKGLLLAVVDRREERKGLYYCSIIPQTDDRLCTRLVCLEWNSPILGRIEKLYKLCKLAL